MLLVSPRTTPTPSANDVTDIHVRMICPVSVHGVSRKTGFGGGRYTVGGSAGGAGGCGGGAIILAAYAFPTLPAVAAKGLTRALNNEFDALNPANADTSCTIVLCG